MKIQRSKHERCKHEKLCYFGSEKKYGGKSIVIWGKNDETEEYIAAFQREGMQIAFIIDQYRANGKDMLEPKK